MFCADLHIHSRFSRATSSRLTIPNLAVWAGLKGIDVMGTGDFTHPAWRDELKAGLVPDEASGLYRLKTPLTPADVERESGLGGISPAAPLFLLQAEISSIYKKNGAVRKVHSIIFAPCFEAADALSARLELLGNIRSDGRPILGLDVRNLLEMTLEAGCLMVPAHVWTPWFSLFGSKSGFDSLEECFGDLTPHIFALETGLSSDPDMNRCWSHLDHLALISNSDAHSGENLGREANLFSGSPSWQGMFDALKRSARAGAFSLSPAALSGHNCEFLGTLEFFPEEGKYHLDGHRACHISLTPQETVRLNGICPVCGKPLTVGVLHRVLALADRTAPPLPGAGFHSLIPLAEILGELLGCGPKTRKPQQKLAEIQYKFGPELHFLINSNLSDVSCYWPELGEALRRMRANEVIRQSGYDGEYGTIRLFDAPRARSCAIVLGLPPETPPGGNEPPQSPSLGIMPLPEGMGEGVPHSVAQKEAMEAGPEAVLVLAGPGAGKTRTLAGRVAWLLEGGAQPEQVAAVTFTRRAAKELRERVEGEAKEGQGERVAVDTLHALALEHWPEKKPVLLSEAGARKALGLSCEGLPEGAWEALALAREKREAQGWIGKALQKYGEWKAARGLADYTDLLEKWLERLEQGEERPWSYVLVDEIQDMSPLQIALLAKLLPEDGKGFFGIGDPDQAIYGFRGAVPDVADRLKKLWPNRKEFTLKESFRSSAGILEAGQAVVGARPLRSVTGKQAAKLWLLAPGAEQEAAWVAERVAGLVGGTSHSMADASAALKGCHLEPGSCGLGDIAILVRLKSLMEPFRKALERRGIPCSVPESEAFWLDGGVQSLLADAAAFVMGGLPQGEQEGQMPVAVPQGIWQGGLMAVLKLLKEQNPVFCAAPAFAALGREYKGRDWPDILADVALKQEFDLVKAKAEQVQIMTMHAAKGLEFKAVFLPCLEDGILPFSGAKVLLEGGTAKPEELAEERRLLYVGITRASEAVFASAATCRRVYGHQLALPPSQLLPLEHFQTISLVRHVKTKREQLSLFS